MLDEPGGRQDRIGAALFDVHMAVAIAIDAEFDDVLGQHLHLADLTGPGTGIAGGVKVAVLDHLDQGEEVRPEEFRAAAVMGEGNEGIAGVEITLDGPKVGLHGPEGRDHSGRDAVFLFGADKNIGKLLDLLATDVESGLADGAAGEFEEGLAEDALRAVAGENLLVDGGAGQCFCGNLRRGSCCDRFCLDAFQESREVTAALLLGLHEAGRSEEEGEGERMTQGFIHQSVLRGFARADLSAPRSHAGHGWQVLRSLYRSFAIISRRLRPNFASSSGFPQRR